MLVREVVVKELVEPLAGAAIRLIVEPQTPLFLDSFTLVVEVLLRDRE